MNGQGKERGKATPDLVSTIGTRSTRTPEPAEPLVERCADQDFRTVVDKLTGKGSHMPIGESAWILDVFINRLVDLAQSAPVNSRGRARIFDLVAAMTWKRVRGSDQQNWQIDEAEAVELIRKVTAVAGEQDDKPNLLAVLLEIPKSLSMTVSLSKSQQEYK